MTDVLRDREIVTQTTHEDVVRAAAEQVLTRDIPWDGYQKANMITDKQLDLIRKYDKKNEETKRNLLAKDGEAYAELFLELLLQLNKEETFQYLLTLIDAILSDNSSNVKLFLNLSSKKPGFPYDPIIRILTRSSSDWYTNSKASSILAVLMSSTSGEISEQNVKFMCQWIRTQLRSNEEKDIANAVSALMKFLRRDDFRPQFASEDGLLFLGSLLKSKNKSYQLTYQTLYSLWLLTYNKNVVNMISSTKVIQYIIDTLKAIQKEKIVRMCLAILVNLQGNSQNNEQMLDAGIQKPLDLMGNKQWGDEDIISDLKTLRESLESNIQELSSFDVYRREVVSGNLEWSPVHKSEKFWKENSHRLEEENFKLLNLLKGYITNSEGASNPLTTSVACFDLGEFARIHPRGRSILQQLNIKIPLMQLMEDRDPEVKKQALAAVQKLMVFNWEYLSMA